MSHLQSSISLSAAFLPLRVCFFFMDWAEVWHISPDAGLPPFCTSLNKNQCFHSVHAPPFNVIPKSREIEKTKKNFSAAKAVIPCCQSLLYCRSCICSCLTLSIDGVGAANASTGTITLFHKPAKLNFSTDGSAFCGPKGGEMLSKYVYPVQQHTSKFAANTQLHRAYRNILYTQIWWAGHTASELPRRPYHFCLFGLGSWFGPQIMLAESLKPESPALNWQTCRVWKDDDWALAEDMESFKDANKCFLFSLPLLS